MLPAGFTWYRDPAGFSVAVPAAWQVSRQGHRVYVRDPHGGRLLTVNLAQRPRLHPLANWRRAEAARSGGYPGYQRIRLAAVRYAPAERAADWEFTYYRDGQLTRVLERNILVSAEQSYVLSWSAPAGQWHASMRYFRTFAATFRPAGTVLQG